MKTKYTFFTRLTFMALTLSISGLISAQGISNEYGSVNNATTGGYSKVGLETTTHLSLDPNEVQARINTTPSTLYLNYWGGSLDLLGSSNTTGDLNIDGQVYYDNSANRLGIGTTSPLAKLHVAGLNSADMIRLTSTGTSAGITFFQNNSTATADRAFAMMQNGRFRIANNIPGDDIDFYTTSGGGAAGSRLTIEDDGDVGIGTSSPTYKLELNVTGSDGLYINGNDAGDAQLRIENGGGFHYLFDDDSDGHALKVESANAFIVNTGGVNEAFEIQTDNDVLFKDATGANALGLNTDPTVQELETYSADFLIDANGGDIRFETGNVVNFVLEEAGDLLISSTIKLDGLEITNLGSNNLGLDGDLVPFSNVLFDVGNNSASEHWDQFWGTSFNTYSDRRYKENISDLEGGLAKVMALKPVRYTYKSTIDMSGKPQLGFIAQDVQSVIPEAITDSDTDIVDGVAVTTQNEYLGMEYIKIIPVLTKAIQEQQEIIEELKSRIEVLEK